MIGIGIPTISPWYRDSKFMKALGVTFGTSLGGLFVLYETLDLFKITLPDWTSHPYIVFLLLSLHVCFLRVISGLSANIIARANAQGEPVPDSILQILHDAESNSRWNEIVKLGTALTEFLWYTSRKKLRIEVGHIVAMAARQANDSLAEARTLIEDLGNTIMTLGDVDQGISYINRGIKIAEDHGYSFLACRGYRNLANCYSYKGDSTNAIAALTRATDYAQSLTDASSRLDALGAIEYANCKAFEVQKQYADALKALDRAVDYYEQLEQLDPSTAAANQDRLVKVYRERSVVYLQMGTDDSIDRAADACQTALQLAHNSQSFENVVRCCCILGRIYLHQDAISAAEGVMSIAAKNVAHIDSPKILDEYTRIARRVANAGP